MTERSGGFGPRLALLIGALAVAVAVVLFAAYNRGEEDRGRRPEIAVDLPAADIPLPSDAPRLPDVPIPTPK